MFSKVCLYAPALKDEGYILSVFMSVRASLLSNQKYNNISLLLLNEFSFKAHIKYEGTSHRYTSGDTMVKVICKGQGQILRSHFQKMAILGLLVFHKHIVLLFVLRHFKFSKVFLMFGEKEDNSKKSWRRK